MAQPPTLPFLAQAAYADRRTLPRTELLPAGRVEAGPPHVLPAADVDYFGAAPMAYDAPAVTRTVLRDTLVRGGSNLLTPPDAILRHDLVRMAGDLLPDEFYDRLVVADDGQTAAWRTLDPFDVAYVPEAAAFTDGVASNYAHWMTEVLPRLAALMRDPAARRLPLLLDAGLHRNIMRSAQLVAGPDADIRLVPQHHVVRADRLHAVSTCGYTLFKLREGWEMEHHGVFSPAALRNMAEMLKHAVAAPAPADRPKVLIRRSSGQRLVETEADLQSALERRGFVVVAPETLSFDEQVALYSRAKVVIGATGAAIANLLFCPPDCATIVLMPKFRHTGYWYWRSMAAAAGAGPVLHVAGEQIDPADDPWDAMAAHKDFRIRSRDVLDAVEVAEALTGA